MVQYAAHEDGGARGHWQSFSYDGCEQVAFLAANAHPQPTGLMIAWETSNSAVWQHEHKYVITTTKWDNYPLQVTLTCCISRVWGCGRQRITTCKSAKRQRINASTTPMRSQTLTKMWHPRANTAHPTMTSKNK